MQPQFLTSQGVSESAYEFESAAPEATRPLKTGPSQFSSAYAGAPQAQDLGVVARSYRQTRPEHHPRTYTNDDINRIQQTPNTLPVPQAAPRP
jgi:hypothetical protein